jgi:hypothetical protein
VHPLEEQNVISEELVRQELARSEESKRRFEADLPRDYRRMKAGNQTALEVLRVRVAVLRWVLEADA